MLQVSPATLYNWRRTYGGMDTDAANELKKLREQNTRLQRLLAEAKPKKDALRPRRGHARGHAEHVGTVRVQGCWTGHSDGQVLPPKPKFLCS